MTPAPDDHDERKHPVKRGVDGPFISAAAIAAFLGFILLLKGIQLGLLAIFT